MDLAAGLRSQLAKVQFLPRTQIFMSCPMDSALGLRNQVAKVRFLHRTLTALAYGLGDDPPKVVCLRFDSSQGRCGNRATAQLIGLITRRL